MYTDFAVSVKWQKEVFSNVEIDTTQPPYVFKCQLFDLTGVPPERQKIMVKGGLLKVYIIFIEFCSSNKILNNKNMFILLWIIKGVHDVNALLFGCIG